MGSVLDRPKRALCSKCGVWVAEDASQPSGLAQHFNMKMRATAYNPVVVPFCDGIADRAVANEASVMTPLATGFVPWVPRVVREDDNETEAG